MRVLRIRAYSAYAHKPHASVLRMTPGDRNDMIDIIYVAGTVAFFALMLAYVAGCERLGAMSDADLAVGESRK